VCRKRASELRRAAAQLDRGDLRPEVVRELVEKIVEVPLRAAAVDGTAEEWSTILEQLIATLGDPNSVLVRCDHDHQRLYRHLMRLPRLVASPRAVWMRSPAAAEPPDISS
jgi:hypothetical protein